MTKRMDMSQMNEIITYLENLTELQTYATGVRTILDTPKRIPVLDTDGLTIGYAVFDGLEWVFDPEDN